MKTAYRIEPENISAFREVNKHVVLRAKVWKKLTEAAGDMDGEYFSPTNARAFARAARTALGRPRNTQLAGPRGPIPVFCDRPQLKAQKGLDADDLRDIEEALEIFETSGAVRVVRVPDVE